MHSLTHDELQRDVHQHVQVSVAAGHPDIRVLGKHPVELLDELFLDVLGAPRLNHVLNHVLLGVEDYVSELTEILTHNLGVVMLIEEYLLCGAHEYLGILQELLEERVQDPIVEVFRLREPRLAGETQRRVVLLQEVQDVVQCRVPTMCGGSLILVAEGLILVIKRREVPKDREFLDASFLDLSRGLFLEIIDYDLRKKGWQEIVKLFQQCDDLEVVFFLPKQGPECLNDLRAVVVPRVLQHLIDALRTACHDHQPVLLVDYQVL